MTERCGTECCTQLPVKLKAMSAKAGPPRSRQCRAPEVGEGFATPRPDLAAPALARLVLVLSAAADAGGEAPRKAEAKAKL